MAKFIHTMFRVRDLDRSLAFYREAFGLEISKRLDFEDFSLVYLRNEENDVEVEFTWNKDQETPYEHGDGYGHIAFVVDDLDAEHERFVAAGFEPKDIVEFAPGGEPGEGEPALFRISGPLLRAPGVLRLHVSHSGRRRPESITDSFETDPARIHRAVFVLRRLWRGRGAISHSGRARSSARFSHLPA